VFPAQNPFRRTPSGSPVPIPSDSRFDQSGVRAAGACKVEFRACDVLQSHDRGGPGSDNEHDDELKLRWSASRITMECCGADGLQDRYGRQTSSWSISAPKAATCSSHTSRCRAATRCCTRCLLLPWQPDFRRVIWRMEAPRLGIGLGLVGLGAAGLVVA
jgi:hypothetical protein